MKIWQVLLLLAIVITFAAFLVVLYLIGTGPRM